MCSRTPPLYLYLTDGGPVEDLGLVPLLRRKKKWILSFDVGDDPRCELIDLRAAIKLALEEKICRFRNVSLEEDLTAYIQREEPVLHLKVDYLDAEGQPIGEGQIFHVRLRLLPPEKPVQALVQCWEVDPRSRRLEQPVPQQEIQLEEARPADSSRPERPLVTDAPPRSTLGGICCECCHRWAKGHVCGAFPNTHTVNQFFTPLLWANFCRLGREMAAPAIHKLVQAQEAVNEEGLGMRHH